jgi:hypothetical protein
LGEFAWLRYVRCITTLGSRFAGEDVEGEVYQVFIGRMTEAWYALGKAGQDDLWERVTAAEAAVGAKFVIACDSAWCSEHYHFFGVSAHPSVAAVQEVYRAYGELDWMRYVNTISVLGTRSMASGAST